MNFFVFTILKEENVHHLDDFVQECMSLNLPVRIGIVDMRAKKFDETRKKIKKLAAKGIYFFNSNSGNENDAVITGFFHAKSENYLSSAFISMDMEVNENELTTLFVRSQDLNAVVPKTFLNDEGLGYRVAFPTVMDFGTVYCQELQSDSAGYPEKVFCISATELRKMNDKASDLLGTHETYRMFQINNIRFSLVENCIFNQRKRGV